MATLIGKMGIRARADRAPGLSAPEIIEGEADEYIAARGEGMARGFSLSLSFEETKERSRFNASNVGRDKLSKHFSRYYQALCADLYTACSPPRFRRRSSLNPPLYVSTLIFPVLSPPQENKYSHCSYLFARCFARY